MSESQSDSALSLLAICGITGPILDSIIVITLGLFRPNYNHVTQIMSELGEVGAPNALIMNTAGFILLGLLMISFAFGLHRGISEGEGSKIGPALVAASGSWLVLLGLFPCDPGCANESFVGITHEVFAIMHAFTMIFAPLAIAQRLKKDNRWQGYLYYSLATGVLGAVLASLYGFNVFEPWKGALQRVLMGVPLLWVEVMAIKLLRLSVRSSACARAASRKQNT
jgi:hypothetical membrane protein